MRIKLIIFSLLTIVSFASVQGQTYYYERVAVVENGQKRSDTGDGHFITFTRDGRCFDSDNRGYNENFGIRKLSHQQDGIACYEGQSYWGSARYLFNSDKSRLNIQLASGKTYVYTRKVAPTGVTSSNRTQQSPSTLIIPTHTPTPSTPNSNHNSSSNSSSSSNSQSRYGYYTCPSCYGSGRCPICHGKHIVNNSYTGGSHICYSCNNHGECSACNGKGKKYGIIR